MIYMITNVENNKRYIGKTERDLEVRWYHHCKSAEHSSQTYLHRAIRKYGKDKFNIVFLCEGGDNEERKMIALLKPEYNMTKGGDGGDTSHSPNFMKAMKKRKHIGVSNFGDKLWVKGCKHSPESKKKMSSSCKTKKPVQVDGIYYESVMAASRALGRSQRYVRLHDELNNWAY